MILPSRYLPRSEPIKAKSLMAKSSGKAGFEIASRNSDFGFLSDFGLRISDFDAALSAHRHNNRAIGADGERVERHEAPQPEGLPERSRGLSDSASDTAGWS
jgi:hypothetical protein